MNIPNINYNFNSRILFIVLKKNIYLYLLIFIIATIIGLVYHRYTQPTYTALSILQIKNENKTNQLLNINNELLRENDLFPIIELIRSKEFIKLVAVSLPLDISYHRQGKFISTELYTQSPFDIKYSITNPSLYNNNIKCVIDKGIYNISYSIGDNSYKYELSSNKWYDLQGMQLFIVNKDSTLLTNNDQSINNNYFFTIKDSTSVLKELLANLSVQILNEKAGTIQITYQAFNAIKSASIANAIAENFIRYDEAKKKESATNTIKYIDDQADKLLMQLNQNEKDLLDFRLANNINLFKDNTSTQENLKQKLFNQIQALEEQNIKNTISLNTLNVISNIITTNKNIKIYEMLALLPDIQIQGYISTMLTSLQDLINRRELYLYDVTTNNTKIKIIDNQIVNMKNNILDYINSYINRLQTEKAEIAKTIASMKTSETKDAIPKYDEIEYARLQRLYTINESFYSQLLQTRAEALISQAGYASNNSIIDKATVPSSPTSPILKSIIIISITIAFVISILIILISYLLYDKIITEKDITDYIDIPILGIIPIQEKMIDNTDIIVHLYPKSIISEAFRLLRANIDFYPIAEKCRVVTITSTVSGEGKTFVSLNLAAIIAMVGKKVIYIDMDLRKKRKTQLFNKDNNTKGISTLLISKDKLEDCIYKSDIDNLDFIPNGPLPPNPAELILNNKFNDILETLKKEYDVIVIDTAPIGIVTDAMSLLNISHNPIYIFKSGQSSRQFVNDITSLTQNNQIKNLSIILNYKKNNRYNSSKDYKYKYAYTSYYNDYTYFDGNNESEIPTVNSNFKQLIKKIAGK